MAEALLTGLRALVLTSDSRDLFTKLIDIMREPLDYESAFVLLLEDDGSLVPAASSDPLFTETVWSSRAMFERVLTGHPTAVFDTERVEEWRIQSEGIRSRARSALHFSIRSKERRAMFVCTSSEPAHFSRNHIRLARRFSVLATQALQNMESEAKIANLEERLAAEAKIAVLNMKLAESEKKLARAKKMEALGLLAGGVAHDLNNILSGIVSYPDLLLMKNDLSLEQRNAIQIIQKSGLKAAAVIEDLVTVARGVASPRETVNLNEIIQELIASPEQQTLQRICNAGLIKTELEPELLNIKASRIHIEKALMNLALNSSDAVRKVLKGQILISTHNRYVDQPLKGYEEIQVGEYAVLAVADNGPGILSQDLERIFEPFYARKIMGKTGTGLGLTIIYNTMRDHDGYINILTGEQGTTFSLYFPITRDPLKEQTPKIPVEAYRGKGQKILVVDDQEDQRKITSAILTELGYRVEAVSSGEDAVEYLGNHPVDLIILDMIMPPGINGREAYERITRIRPNQKALIASGYALTDEVRSAQKLGAGCFIRKPFTLEKLGTAVRDELAK